MLSAFVLHSRPYRETSSLVYLFSAELGKVSVVAKGVRTKRSPLKGILQPAVPLLVELGGRGDLKQLYKAEASSLAFPLFAKYLYSALYLNELLYILLEEQQPYPALYQHYQQCLFDLAKQQPIEPCLRQFELRLFAELGYGLSLSEKIHPDLSYAYHLEEGFVPIAPSNPIALSGRQLETILSFDWQAQDLPLAKRLCRYIIQQLLKGRELRSRSLFSPHKLRINKNI